MYHKAWAFIKFKLSFELLKAKSIFTVGKNLQLALVDKYYELFYVTLKVWF